MDPIPNQRSNAMNLNLKTLRGILANLLAGGLAAGLFERTGTWDYAFYGSAALALASALTAIALLKMPAPQKRHAAAEAVASRARAAHAADGA